MVSLAAEQQTVVREGEDVVIQLERAVVTNTNTTVLLAVANTLTPGEHYHNMMKPSMCSGTNCCITTNNCINLICFYVDQCISCPTTEIEERVIKVVFAVGESKKAVYIPTSNDDVTGSDINYSVHIVPTAGILLGESTETIVTVLDNDGKQWMQLAWNDCYDLPPSPLFSC